MSAITTAFISQSNMALPKDAGKKIFRQEEAGPKAKGIMRSRRTAMISCAPGQTAVFLKKEVNPVI